jgi:type IV pilus assembly protein PilB
MLKPFRRKKLGDILLEQGELTPDQLAYALDRQQATKERLGAICLSDGMISETVLAKALAGQFGLEYIDLKGYRPNEEIFNLIQPEMIYRYQFIPLELQGEVLVVAISDPTAVLKLDEISLLLERPLLFKVAAESEIAFHLKRGEGTSRVLKEVSEDFMLQIVTETEKGEEILSVENVTADTSPIIKLVNSTILDALTRRTSDIHIETAQEGVIIKYRIDGVLYKATDPIDSHFQGPLISRLKVMSELDISERRIPQDGRFKVRIGAKSIDFRVSIMPSVHGEDAVIRILDKESISEQFTELRLDILGFPEAELKRFRKYIAEPYGMVLVTGPTGSGKTTTLYAALSEIKSIEDKIITIEDPVEYQLKGITQIPINEKKGLTFARGLRSILRHDPDKIMVGEIRDNETAQIAINSALTGHLVFTTVHANNVLDVLGRFLNMGVEAYQFVSALNCVLAQRLVRNICIHCKRPVKVSRELLEESGLAPALEHTHTFYEGVGCLECGGTGYKGRTAICELLDLSDHIREMILEKRPTSEIKKAAREEGMRFLRESAVERVMHGVTTLREINKVTFVE